MKIHWKHWYHPILSENGKNSLNGKYIYEFLNKTTPRNKTLYIRQAEYDPGIDDSIRNIHCKSITNYMGW